MRSTRRWATASSATAIATSSRSGRFRSDRIVNVLSSGKFGKTHRHRPIDLAPERHHEIGGAVEPLPAPLVEFRRLAVAWRQRIDVGVGPGKTQRKPFLALTAEFCQSM